MDGEDDADRNSPGGALEQRLRRAALAYLERWASSEANLTRVLIRKLARWRREAGVVAGARPSETEEASAVRESRPADAGMIARVVDHCRRLGMVDDRAYAETKVASGRRRGRSARKIEAGLAARGVDRGTVGAALADSPIDEGRAALAFAKRKRLGPWRSPPSDDPAIRRRDMAALARQGYAPSLARKIASLSLEDAENEL